MLIAPTHHAGLATIPLLLLKVGSLRRLESLCPWDLDQTTGLLYREGDIERNPGPKRALHPRGRDIMVHVLPTAVQRYDVAVSEFEEYLRVRDIHGLEELVSNGVNELGHACIQYLQVWFASGSPRSGQAGTLISSLRRHVLSARPCGADLEDHQSVFRTSWRVHGSWSLAIPAEFRTSVSHGIVLSVATSAWHHDVPEPSLSKTTQRPLGL